MIKQTRNHLFGGQFAEIWNHSFHCIIQTSKEGLFQSHSTLIHEIIGTNELADSRLTARLLYPAASTKKHCIEIHEKIVERFDSLGQDQWNMTLDLAVEMVTFQFSDSGHWEWLTDHTGALGMQRVFTESSTRENTHK